MSTDVLKSKATRNTPVVKQLGLVTHEAREGVYHGDTWGISVSGCYKGLIKAFGLVLGDLGESLGSGVLL